MNPFRSAREAEHGPPPEPDGPSGTENAAEKDGSHHSSRDDVPQLPNIGRTSIAVGRTSRGPSSPHHGNDNEHMGNGSAVPSLVKVNFTIRNWELSSAALSQIILLPSRRDTTESPAA